MPLAPVLGGVRAMNKAGADYRKANRPRRVCEIGSWGFRVSCAIVSSERRGSASSRLCNVALTMSMYGSSQLRLVTEAILATQVWSTMKQECDARAPTSEPVDLQKPTFKKSVQELMQVLALALGPTLFSQVRGSCDCGGRCADKMGCKHLALGCYVLLEVIWRRSVFVLKGLGLDMSTLMNATIHGSHEVLQPPRESGHQPVARTLVFDHLGD